MYELVEEYEMEEKSKKKTKAKGEYYIDVEEKNIRERAEGPISDRVYTLYDKNGNQYWSLKYEDVGEFNYNVFTVSNKGITVVTRFDAEHSIVWLNKEGKVINRLSLDKCQEAYPRSIKNGNYWLIETGPDMMYHDNISGLAGVIICDAYGNKVNQIDYKHKEPEGLIISRNGNYIMSCCTNWRANKYHSYLFTYTGRIIKEYEGRDFTWRGSFSPDEKLFIGRGDGPRIIDTETGEVLAGFRSIGTYRVANKETGIVAATDFETLRIFNYNTEEKLFYMKLPKRPINLWISGDGKEVSVSIKKHYYKYRMVE